MTTTHLGIFAAALFAFAASGASAFETVREESKFVSLLEGKQLTRLGIRLAVSPTGEIQGRAFGKPVTGQWAWRDGYFCRDLSFGDDPLEPNCQMVKVRGQTMRFISDRGEGIWADLRIN